METSRERDGGGDQASYGLCRISFRGRDTQSQFLCTTKIIFILGINIVIKRKLLK